MRSQSRSHSSPVRYFRSVNEDLSAADVAATDTPVAATSAGLSRRGVLGLTLGGGAAIALGGFGGYALAKSRDGVEQSAFDFFGEHQAGITTPVQEHLHFAAFDMMDRSKRDDLIELLQDWTYAAARITQGLDVSASGAVGGSPELPPDDTGEALGLPASGLTVTFGFGPTLFEKDGADRYGINNRMPSQLKRLPAFLGDDLDPAESDGDLCIQVCADDPQVAVHAIRNLSRIAFGRAKLRWSQLGFGKTSRTTAAQQTPRNLFGFKDGTANILADETEALNEYVWVGPEDGQEWLVGGTYLVARKIAMLIETWDRVRLVEQEDVFGRDKLEGAPLSGGVEMTEPVLAQLPDASHVRLAHPETNGGIRLLRRGFNYVGGNNTLGRLDAGLMFLSYQRSPENFVAVQRTLSTDALNEYIRHVASGVWAVPPGVAAGEYVGQKLFG